MRKDILKIFESCVYKIEYYLGSKYDGVVINRFKSDLNHIYFIYFSYINKLDKRGLKHYYSSCIIFEIKSELFMRIKIDNMLNEEIIIDELNKKYLVIKRKNKLKKL